VFAKSGMGAVGEKRTGRRFNDAVIVRHIKGQSHGQKAQGEENQTEANGHGCQFLLLIRADNTLISRCEHLQALGAVFQRHEGPMVLGTTMLRDNRDSGADRPLNAYNVLGEALEICSMRPMTGFHRDGCCNTGREDVGSHTVCAVMTAAFLDFSKSCGNDLSTPVPELGFPGLKPGDRWCLCAPRWQEALEANQAPRVVLRATHEAALSYCALADLKRLAVDLA
jgi:uncharacterized protein (DUF2237 family)